MVVPIWDTLKDYFKSDNIVVDNVLFKLHYMGNFYLVLIGLIFIFGENYFDSSKIECSNGGDYEKAFCWLHGSGYVPKHLQMAGVTSCFMKQGNDWEETREDGKKYGSPTAAHTAYYVWLPFLLAFCAGFSKAPRVLWKYIEGGKMVDILGDATEKVKDDSKVKDIANAFRDQRRDFWKYHLAFGLCELLNFLMVIASMAISNSILRGMFWSYGTEVLDYIQTKPTAEYKSQEGAEDPRCNLFPTEVSCQVYKGAISGDADSSNHLCILTNNLFNQHYFALMWWWWVILLAVSGVALVYRALRLASGELSRSILMLGVTSNSRKKAIRDLKGTGADYFILGRIKQNVSRKVMDLVVSELGKQGMEIQKEVDISMKNLPYPDLNKEFKNIQEPGWNENLSAPPGPLVEYSA